MPALSPYYEIASPQAQRSVGFASITGSYARVGSLFATGIIFCVVISTLDADVQVSLDGVTDFIPIVAHGSFTWDVKTNLIALPGNLGVYVKQIGVPSTGTLYVCAVGV